MAPEQAAQAAPGEPPTAVCEVNDYQTILAQSVLLVLRAILRGYFLLKDTHAC
jgi:hypothetical protein